MNFQTTEPCNLYCGDEAFHFHGLSSVKSFIFCTSFIQPGKRSACTAKWRKWISYYDRRKDLFGAERIVLIDDGTPLEHIKLKVNFIDADRPLPDELPKGTVMFRFEKHLGRSSSFIFPGWWRSFTFSYQVAKKYSFRRIIHLESDAFVMSPRMARYIKSLCKGWTAFWCPRYNFPEAAIQVICGDAFQDMEAFYSDGKRFWSQEAAAFPPALPEHALPFTNINKKFVGDRYGDYRSTIPKRAAYATQTLLTMNVFDKLVPPGEPRTKGSRKPAMSQIRG